MSKKRREFSSDFKFRVALEAAKEQQTISELPSASSVYPNQISHWKRQLLESGVALFTQNGTDGQRDQEGIQSFCVTEPS